MLLNKSQLLKYTNLSNLPPVQERKVGHCSPWATTVNPQYFFEISYVVNFNTIYFTLLPNLC